MDDYTKHGKGVCHMRCAGDESIACGELRLTTYTLKSPSHYVNILPAQALAYYPKHNDRYPIYVGDIEDNHRRRNRKRGEEKSKT